MAGDVGVDPGTGIRRGGDGPEELPDPYHHGIGVKVPHRHHGHEVRGDTSPRRSGGGLRRGRCGSPP